MRGEFPRELAFDPALPQAPGPELDTYTDGSVDAPLWAEYALSGAAAWAMGECQELAYLLWLKEQTIVPPGVT